MTAPPTTEPNEPSPWAVLAHVRRPQGRKGEVFADILTDFPEKFAERRRLWLVRDGTGARLRIRVLQIRGPRGQVFVRGVEIPRILGPGRPVLLTSNPH